MTWPFLWVWWTVLQWRWRDYFSFVNERKARSRWWTEQTDKRTSTCYIKFSYNIFFFFCSCCKMWTSTDVRYIYFPSVWWNLFVFYFIFYVLWTVFTRTRMSLSLSSDAMEPQLFFLCSPIWVYKYIYSVYLYMYESKYIYIVDIRMCTVWEGLLCIYSYVRIAAKAKQMGWHYKILCFNTSSFVTSLHFIL